ncbi:MAG: type II toxin-antitoxin system HicB family antitoxin [Spirochaetia bacterium]|nr:type II toxin-antitoxin system HicB family antitoxin [Spirochaetia bacterium]
MRKFIVLFEKSKDGYDAYVPDLPGCVAFGDTKEETEELIFESIKFHVEGLEREGELIPQAVTDSEVMVI